MCVLKLIKSKCWQLGIAVAAVGSVTLVFGARMHSCAPVHATRAITESMLLASSAESGRPQSVVMNAAQLRQMASGTTVAKLAGRTDHLKRAMIHLLKSLYQAFAADSSLRSATAMSHDKVARLRARARVRRE